MTDQPQICIIGAQSLEIHQTTDFKECSRDFRRNFYSFESFELSDKILQRRPLIDVMYIDVADDPLLVDDE